MPVIQSAKKRVKTSEKRHARNLVVKSEMRAALKKFESKIQGQNVDEAKEAFANAVKKIEKAARKGVIHKNKAAKQKSKLAKKLNQLSA